MRLALAAISVALAASAAVGLGADNQQRRPEAGPAADPSFLELVDRTLGESMPGVDAVGAAAPLHRSMLDAIGATQAGKAMLRDSVWGDVVDAAARSVPSVSPGEASLLETQAGGASKAQARARASARRDLPGAMDPEALAVESADAAAVLPRFMEASLSAYHSKRTTAKRAFARAAKLAGGSAHKQELAASDKLYHSLTGHAPHDARKPAGMRFSASHAGSHSKFGPYGSFSSMYNPYMHMGHPHAWLGGMYGVGATHPFGGPMHAHFGYHPHSSSILKGIGKEDDKEDEKNEGKKDEVADEGDEDPSLESSTPPFFLRGTGWPPPYFLKANYAPAPAYNPAHPLHYSGATHGSVPVMRWY